MCFWHVFSSNVGRRIRWTFLRTPPKRSDGQEQLRDYKGRAEIGARILRPHEFLHSRVRQHPDRTQARSPEEIGCCPREVGVELVVQAPGEQHADRHAPKHCIHDEERANAIGYQSLQTRIDASGIRLHKVEDTATGGFDPSRVKKEDENAKLGDEERKGEFPIEECCFADEAPVDRPFEQKLSAEIEGGLYVLSAFAAHDEGQSEGDLDDEFSGQQVDQTENLVRITNLQL
jgi:hypothetical protein